MAIICQQFLGEIMEETKEDAVIMGSMWAVIME
jgi:hypothetical protein